MKEAVKEMRYENNISFEREHSTVGHSRASENTLSLPRGNFFWIMCSPRCLQRNTLCRPHAFHSGDRILEYMQRAFTIPPPCPCPSLTRISVIFSVVSEGNPVALGQGIILESDTLRKIFRFDFVSSNDYMKRRQVCLLLSWTVLLQHRHA